MVILGDSIVAGWGLAPEESYPALLNRRLAPLGWQVINAGEPGETIVQGALRYDGDVAARQPDLLLLAFGLNDGCPVRNASDRWREQRLISRRLGCERSWLRLSRRLPWRHREPRPGRPRTRPAMFEGTLARLVRNSRRLGAEVCLLSLTPVDGPRLPWPGQWESYQRYQGIIARLARREGISYLNLWSDGEPAFDGDSMWVDDGVHLQAAGARWLADRVHAHLVAEGML